jgi:hypothetical protein
MASPDAAMSARMEEQSQICCVDLDDRDLLLEKLIAVHGAPRADLPPELTAALGGGRKRRVGKVGKARAA